MLNKSLTEKDWLVLNYFIENESREIKKCFRNNGPWKSESYQHFLSYPAKIESDLKNNISRPKAGASCKKLKEMDILNSQKKYPRLQGGETDHYYLNSDLHIIRKLVRLIVKSGDHFERIQIIDNHYFMHHINESLVKEVLNEKQVTITRSFSLLECDVEDVKIIFKKYTDYSNNELGKLVKSCIDKFENRQKSDEQSYIEDLHRVCNDFLENYKDNSIDLVKLYDSDYRFIDRMLKPNYQSLNKEFNRMFFTPFSIRLKFPVFNDDFSNDEIINEIKKSNESGLDEHPSLTYFQSGINSHYEDFQYRELILPILSLIHSSPEALNEFINGNWKTFNLDFNLCNDSEGSDFLSNLFFVAWKDIITNLQIQKNGIAKIVFSRAFLSNASSTSIHPNIFQDLRTAYYNSLSFEKMEKMENSDIIIRLKHLYEIYFNMRFIASDERKNESMMSVRYFIEYSPEIAFSLLTINDIIDSKGLISKLKDEKNPLYNYIRSKLSNYMQNIILYYDTENEPSVEFQKLIVDDLNSAIIGGDFYDKKAFMDIVSPNDEILNKTIKILSEYHYSKNEIINMKYEIDYTSSLVIIQENRYLLEKVFPKEIDQHFSTIKEGTHQ